MTWQTLLQYRESQRPHRNLGRRPPHRQPGTNGACVAPKLGTRAGGASAPAVRTAPAVPGAHAVEATGVALVPGAIPAAAGAVAMVPGVVVVGAAGGVAAR